MKCPYCSSDNTRVIDSRPADDNNSIRRRRLCDECGKRFTTYEKVETIPLIIVKKDAVTGKALKGVTFTVPNNQSMESLLRAVADAVADDE